MRYKEEKQPIHAVLAESEAYCRLYEDLHSCIIGTNSQTPDCPLMFMLVQSGPMMNIHGLRHVIAKSIHSRQLKLGYTSGLASLQSQEVRTLSLPARAKIPWT